MRSTVMIPISEEEELEIDKINNKTLHFHRGDRTFSVQTKDIYCYGEIDFNDKDTIDKINDFNFLEYLGAIGVYIFANYDYNTHSCNATKKGKQWTETWNPVTLVKLAHAYLGKPQRILLFNQTTK